MLSCNVAGLLQSTPGTARTYPVHEIALPLEGEARLAAPIDGQLRLARTNRGILVRAELATALAGTCGRCLRAVVSPITIRLEEEALPSIDIATGQAIGSTADPETLRIDDHHELDLSEPVREAILLDEPLAVLCRPDCRGLCPVCGLDLNDHPGHDHGPAPVDPRLAGLAEWRAGQGDDPV